MDRESSDGHKPKQAVLYARVSTDEQARSGYSLPVQVKQLRAHAEENAYEIVMEAMDDGYEGDSSGVRV